MGLSVDLELACDHIEMNSKHKAFSLPIDQMDDTTSETAAVASTTIDIKVKSNESSISLVRNELKASDVAEPEEGEIINSDEGGDIDNNDFEYEAISSDEEYTLRQKIEALEARNSELEKIHSISARSQDAYDIGFGTATIYSHYKNKIQQQFVDEKSFAVSKTHRKTQFRPMISHTISHKLPVRISTGKHSLDAISSGEECIALSDIGSGTIYRENGKFYDRSHHHHSSSTSRRRKHYRDHHDRRYSEDERDNSSRTHVKRRSCDMVRPKRRRLKPVRTSSDDDCFEVTSREELKVALNINDAISAYPTINRSTLLHKLKAIHNKSSVVSDHEDDVVKQKSTKKKRCRNKSKSQNELQAEIHVDEQAIDDGFIDAIFEEGNHPATVEEEEGVDEAVSLEEQELRLIALKSAVMKKHEARKQRQLVLAYSPTDSLLTALDDDGGGGGGGVDAGAGAGDGHAIDQIINHLDVIDDTEDNNNMDISPASSPQSNPTCQPMDMDLVSSNDDDSRSPVVFSSLPKDIVFHSQPNNGHYVNWVYGIPLMRNQNFDNWSMGDQPHFQNANIPLATHTASGQTQPPFETKSAGGMEFIVPTIANVEENALRARLIADLNCERKQNANAFSESNEATIVDTNTGADDINQDESLEADCLRSLLLSSIKHKKLQSATDASDAAKKAKSTEIESMMDLPNLPKITLNLKEAVKRFQNNNNKNNPCPVFTDTISHPQQTKVLVSKVVDVVETPKIENVPAEVLMQSLMQTANVEPVTVMSIDKNNDIQCAKPKVKQMTAPHSGGVVKIPIKLPQTITAQTPPKTTASKESTSTPAKTITAVPKKVPIVTNAIKIAACNVESSSKIGTLSARYSPTVSSHGKHSPVTVSSATKKSAVTTNNMGWKPVQKLVISLNADDSSTTDFEEDTIPSDEVIKCTETRPVASPGMSAEALRAFDNASPASIAMDSPSMAPCSPIDGESSLSAANDAIDDSPLAIDSTKNTSDAFQVKLDEYLKQVRAKTDTTQEGASPSNDAAAATKSKPMTEPIAKKTIINLRQKTPVAVCHLPISAQLEYRRLINRMKILEKQKEQKSPQLQHQQTLPNIITVASSAMNETPFANIRVTLKNENRFIQTNECVADRIEEQVSPASSSLSCSVAKLKDSLKKKVLLKNTLNAATAAAAVSNVANDTIPVESQVPIKNVTLPNDMKVDAADDNQSVNERKVSILRNTEAKLNANSKTFLAELETMLQLVCQTQVETKKQLDLESRLGELRLQCKAIENELSCQKMRTMSMLPEIVDKQKTIIARNILSRKMTLYCERIGRKVFGAAYKFECDKEDQIKDTIKSIQGKTKNLKTLAVSVPELSLLNSEMAKATSNRSDNAAISMISKKTGIFGENKIGSDAAVSTIVESKPTPIFPPETLTTSMSTTEENLVICVKYSSLNADETVPHPDVQQFDGAVIVTDKNASSAMICSSNAIETLNKEDDGSRAKYRSPLDHMQNNSGHDAGQSFTDRNAIICPFDLMGTCDDEKCLYQHLTS